MRDYVEKAYYRMQADDNIGAAGGQGIGVSNVEFPAWFKNDGYAYAVGKQGEASGNVSVKKYLWGAGMIFQKINLYSCLFQIAFVFIRPAKGPGYSR